MARSELVHLLKRFIAALPHAFQQELRRVQSWSQIQRGCFRSPEPEHQHLKQFVRGGDWVIDIGANVGHYTSRLSELVGPTGRVIAFEPTPATFEILAANSRHFAYPNVTLINAAVTDRAAVCRIRVPNWSYGSPNYYRAYLTERDGGVEVMCCAIDSFTLPHRISLMKIDVEGVAQAVVLGAIRLIEHDRPILIVEGDADEFLPALAPMSYRAWRFAGSPNVVLATSWPDTSPAEPCEITADPDPVTDKEPCPSLDPANFARKPAGD